MLVECLLTLLAVVLLPPEYPHFCLVLDLSSWTDWKVLVVVLIDEYTDTPGPYLSFRFGVNRDNVVGIKRCLQPLSTELHETI